MSVDISSPKHKADPFPFYARLREESPVHRVTLPDRRTAWLVTRYEDVALVLKDNRFAKDMTKALSPDQISKQQWIPGFLKPLTRNMLDLDEPDHARLRTLVNKAFTPRLVEQMSDRIGTLAADSLARLRGRESFDLIREFALPIPTTIIAEMLGVPAKDCHRFPRWSAAIVSATESSWAQIRVLPSVWMFVRYIRKLTHKRRKHPQEDLLSVLIEVEDEGSRLNEDELLAMVFLLLIAGHETTVNLIGNGVLALLQHPSELERLRNDPTLIESAIEELLRFASPVETATERYAREDIEISGVTIPQGSLVFAAIASANRDERQFPLPDRLDITRDPNKHLSFGLGSHYCLGASLARLEARTAISALLDRIKDLRLAASPHQLRWRGGLVLRGLKSLPVSGQVLGP